MTEQVRITVLAENCVERPGLLAEHGLALWIEAGSQRVLFDTGQGGVLVNNAYRLGISLDRVDAVVLSHGHYDHTGGLVDALRGTRPAAIYLHPEAMKPKVIRNQDGTSREVGMPPAAAESLQRHRDRLVLTDQPTPVAPALMVTGPVPRVTDFEDTGGPFFLDPKCRKPDPLTDDQAVFFESKQGTVVLLGCAHAGVINTLRFVRRLTGERPIHAVLGGMHLVGASPQRLTATIDALRALNPGSLGPAHCTGRTATAVLWESLPDRCMPFHVGTQIAFDLATHSTITK